MSTKRKTVCRSGVLLLGLLLSAVSAPAQHLSVWVGGGIGSFLTGGARDPNGHKFTAGAVAFSSDLFRVRYVQGSLERSKGIPSSTGDNDMDYFGFDAVVTRKVTGWPVDVAAGFSRFEEAYHEGYPEQDRGGSVFVHRWGPHVSALRSLPFWRFFEVWAESDLHYVPYRPRQLVVLVNAGIGAHF